jgi:hypothetical protein
MTTLPSPDNFAALDFFKKMYPDGPWVLTAIRPNPKSIETRTFSPNSEGACLDWMKTLIEKSERSVAFRQVRAHKAVESHQDTAVSP